MARGPGFVLMLLNQGKLNNYKLFLRAKASPSLIKVHYFGISGSTISQTAVPFSDSKDTIVINSSSNNNFLCFHGSCEAATLLCPVIEAALSHTCSDLWQLQIMSSSGGKEGKEPILKRQQSVTNGLRVIEVAMLGRRDSV